MSVTADDLIRPSHLGPMGECPGIVNAEIEAIEKVPALADYSSDIAIVGNQAHEVIAGVLKDGFCGDWSQLPKVMSTLPVRMNGLPTWAKSAIGSCLNYLGNELLKLTRDYPITDLLVEEHLDGACIDTPRGGTADLVILCKKPDGFVAAVHVLDWKTGFRSQGEAEGHAQLQAYACMAWDKYRTPVIVHLVAGRRNEFSVAYFDEKKIAIASQQIRIVAGTARRSHYRVPSLKACYYCKAMCFCPELRRKIMAAQEQFQLFGAEPKDRMQLSEDAQLAKRFAQAAAELIKLWQDQEHHKN